MKKAKGGAKNGKSGDSKEGHRQNGDFLVKDSQTRDPLNGSEIAIIGMVGRFPGAKTIDAFWENLRDGVESITSFSDEQLRDSGVDPEALQQSNYVKARPVLEDIELFDPAFFGISPREAAAMDPQHRLFMECVWEAIETAGYDVESYKGLISLYAGTSMSSYLVNNLYANPQALALAGEYESYLANVPDSLSTRVAYKLNLKGACYTVQTFCSTSLVAVHLACQGLLNFECDMAVAGGVTIFVPQNSGYWYREGLIVSPDGHCRPFDAKAQGTIFGNGLGVVVLKRLEDALADGDHIEAIIIGSATNNDGSLKVSYTAPSVAGQAEVIVEALADAGIKSETIDYVEAHGTGTALGDPTEVTALTRAYRTDTEKCGFCAIGSVKSNIGHLDAAGGVAGLIKTVLAIKHRSIPPSLHFESSNPEINFANSPFFVNSVLSEWQENETPRRAGVSAFGVGGTNAHLIVQEGPLRKPSSTSRPYQLLMLSARTGSALDRMSANLAEHLRAETDLNLADVAYTLKVGRKAFGHRRLVVCRNNIDHAVSLLGAEDSKKKLTIYQERRNPPVVFMFSGQGAQYVNMGLELYQGEVVFRDAVDRCCDTLQAHLDFDLREVMYPSEAGSADVHQQLQQTSIAQPALFTIEYALAQLWMSWGLNPEALVGHSIGEYVAGCLAHVFSLEDALWLVAARGRLMQTMPGGTMLAVSLSEAELQNMLGEDLTIAAVNAPDLCVVSGKNEAVKNLESKLGKREIHFARLHTSHAFHSKMMDPILTEFGQIVKQVQLNSPQIPIVSNSSGKWLKADEAIDSTYWVRHLRQKVRFSDCIHKLIGNSKRILLEIGPGQTLCMLAKQQIKNSRERVVLSSIRHPKEDRSDTEFILTTLGKLWLAGVELDWPAFYREENRYRISLPTYPFERQRFWIEPKNPPLGYPAYHAGLSEVGRATEVLENEVLIDSHLSRDSALASGYVAPRDEVEQKLVEIWQRLLGVNPIGVRDDYFELGGNSLLATRIFAEVEKTFVKKLPLSALLNSPTIEQLANIISSEDWSWSPLVALQPEGVNPPFFCIHGADGQVFVYRDLSKHLGPDQPFYGLQSQGLDGEKSFHKRIEDMASLYVKEIQTVQPEGPYYLGGYCMGGTIAFEMAQQLQSQGQTVDLLVLLETYNWANFKKPSFFNKAHYYKQKIEFHWRNLFLAENKWTFFNEKVKVARNRTKMWAGALQAKFFDNLHRGGNGLNESLARLWEINERAAADYRPDVYPGRITQFRPIKEYAWYLNSDMGWENLTTEGVEDHLLPVYPAGMLVEPFVKKLAVELRKCIVEAANSAVIVN